jgi:hypothetical protein
MKTDRGRKLRPLYTKIRSARIRKRETDITATHNKHTVTLALFAKALADSTVYWFAVREKYSFIGLKKYSAKSCLPYGLIQLISRSESIQRTRTN